MSIYHKELSKSLEKICSIKGSQASSEIESYTEHKLLGLEYVGSSNTKDYWNHVSEWDNHILGIWNMTSPDLTVGEQVKKICEEIYDIEQEYFLDNDTIDPIIREAVVFSALNTVNSLFISDYISKELNVFEPNAKLNSISRKKTIILMVIILIMGTTEDVRKVFYLLMDKNITFLGKKVSMCSILTNDYKDRFTDDFRDILGTLSRTGNFVIDVVFNDSARDFIMTL